jgi:hypothetical protein
MHGILVPVTPLHKLNFCIRFTDIGVLRSRPTSSICLAECMISVFATETRSLHSLHVHSPNLHVHSWSVRVDSGGEAAHVAVTDIRPGDVLTTNRLQKLAVMSTPMRRAFLRAHHSLPDCRCPACTSGADLFQGLPCPACSGHVRSQVSGQLEDAAAWGLHLQDVAFIYRDNARAEARDPRPWQCQLCGEHFANTPQVATEQRCIAGWFV